MTYGSESECATHYTTAPYPQFRCEVLSILSNVPVRMIYLRYYIMRSLSLQNVNYRQSHVRRLLPGSVSKDCVA